MNINDQPIGVFDSGVGGLTVVKEIIKELPNESIIYLGDTARVPYGTRSGETITKFALDLVNFLLQKGVKVLVVACNTISANSLDAIKKVSPVPVVDVISPTTEVAVRSTKNNSVGLIATAGCVNSGAYKRRIKGLNPSIRLWQQACPLFVPLAEEGMDNHPATDLIARGYLSDLSDKQIDTLILGCTHFPILLSSIAKTTGKNVTLVTSGRPTAKKLAEILKKNDLLARNQKPVYQFFFTDSDQRASKIGELFFGEPLPGVVAKVNL